MTAQPTVGGDNNVWGTILNAYLAAGRGFNVMDYGAAGDGVADDTAEIAAAITACSAAGGGIVFLTPGTYLISSLLTIPSSVSIQGSGSAQNAGDAATIIRCTAAAAGLSFTGDGGFHHSFNIDGSTAGSEGTAVATNPFLRYGGVSGATFVDINVRYGNGDGILIQGAQNDAYLGVQSQNNAGRGIVVDAGCGGLYFARCEFSNNLLAQGESTAETDIGSAYDYPTQITWDTCLFERTPDAAYASFYWRFGNQQVFQNCIFTHAAVNGVLFKVGDNNGGVGGVTLENCAFAGRNYTDGNVAIHVGSFVTHMSIRGFTRFNSVQYCIDAPLGTYHADGRWSIEGSASAFTAGTSSSASLPSPLWAGYGVLGSTTSGKALSAAVSGDTVSRFALAANGDMAWGPGSAAADITLVRSGAQELTASNTLASNFFRLNGTGGGGALEFSVEQTSDTAAPSAGCRLFIKDNGGGKTALYARFPTGAAVLIATEP